MSVIVRGKNPNRPYTVRFWVDGKQGERSFRTRKEADDFKIKTDHDVRAQIFVDDRRGKEKFSAAARAWLDRKYVFGNRVAGGELGRVYQGKREPDHRTSE